MPIPFIDLTIQHKRIQKELKFAVNTVLDSHHFVLGIKGRKLESEFVKKIGTRFAVSLASGTDALHLSLLALGIGPGDEVITTPFTFFASAGAISRTGAKPVFVDIDPKTFNMDPAKIESAINRKTKAILPVHLFGLSCDMNAIMKIARQYSLFVIEDAAQAFGAECDGRQAGSFGTTGCFSFYPTKNLGGAGDGGMLTTASSKIAEKVRLLRDHGSRKKYYHELISTNSRLDEIQAAVLLVKLKYLHRWNALRNEYAVSYNKSLSDLPVQTPKIPKGYKHTFHLYSIVTKKRDALVSHLKKAGIGSGVYYPLPLHLQPCYRSLGYQRGDFPISERVARQIISLPMYPGLSAKAIQAVTQSMKEFFE